MRLQLGEIVAYQGVDFKVLGTLDYVLPERSLGLVAIAAAGQQRFLDPLPVGERVLLWEEIAPLDIDTPPPATIYHDGESYLLKVSGTAQVGVAGKVAGIAAGTCQLWRFGAAGGRFLQIEAWPKRIRMLAGTFIHQSMLKVRPARTS